MKALFKKSVIAASIAVATLASGVASATDYNPFSVVSSTLDPTSTYAPFSADKIGGSYVEVISFNNTGGFNVSLRWNASSFLTNGGQDAVLDTGLTARDGYGIYALYTASGTVSTTAAGVTTFQFTAGSGDLSLYLDVNRNTAFTTTPTSGTGTFGRTGTSDDILLASGDPLSGKGTLDPTLSTCSTTTGNNCGSFGSVTSFNLTDEGKEFFVAPNPFYTLSFQSGQLNAFTPTGVRVINGGLDVTFSGGAVPEPASLALLGLGLLGLGAARRRKQNQA